MTDKLYQPFYRGKGKPHPLADNWQLYLNRMPVRFRNRPAIPAKQLDYLEQSDFAKDYQMGPCYEATDELAEAVNIAITLRRPLLLTGDPGCGKTSLGL